MRAMFLELYTQKRKSFEFLESLEAWARADRGFLSTAFLKRGAQTPFKFQNTCHRCASGVFAIEWRLKRDWCETRTPPGRG